MGATMIMITRKRIYRHLLLGFMLPVVASSAPGAAHPLLSRPSLATASTSSRVGAAISSQVRTSGQFQRRRRSTESRTDESGALPRNPPLTSGERKLQHRQLQTPVPSPSIQVSSPPQTDRPTVAWFPTATRQPTATWYPTSTNYPTYTWQPSITAYPTFSARPSAPRSLHPPAGASNDDSGSRSLIVLALIVCGTIALALRRRRQRQRRQPYDQDRANLVSGATGDLELRDMEEWQHPRTGPFQATPGGSQKAKLNLI